MASFREWLVEMLHRLIDRVESSEMGRSSDAATNPPDGSDRAPDDSSPLSHELRSLKSEFARELKKLSTLIQADLRYNRDFLGEDALTQSLKGDSPVDRYASLLDAARKRLLGSHGSSVPAYSTEGATNTGEFRIEASEVRIDVNWFVILSTAVGLNDVAGGALTRDRRVALAGQLAFSVWRESSEEIGDIVRSYYEQISRPEFCVPVPGRIDIAELFGTHNEDVTALLKDLAKIAERLSTTKGRPVAPPVEDDFVPPAHSILINLLTTYRAMDRRSLTQLSQPSTLGVLGVVVLSAMVMGALLVPEQIIRQISQLLPEAVQAMFPQIIGAAGVAAFAVALIQSAQLTRRRARFSSLRATIRSLIRTGTIAYGDASNFFVRFGEPIRKRFLPPRR